MLSKRYQNDRKPTLKLNSLQLDIKNQIDNKVNTGVYVFESVTCVICGCNDFKGLSLKDRYGLYMPVVICKNCSLIQTNPRMNQNSYNDFYNHEYRKLYVGEDAPSHDFLTKQYGQGRLIYNYVIKYLEEKVSDRKLFVLEVGCGAGGILKYFHDNGCRVKGVDLGKEYIEYGKENYGLDLTVGTLSDLDINDKPDLIIYSHVLEHILNPDIEIDILKTYMSNDSFLYIELPGIYNLTKSYKYDFLRMLQNAHVYHFSLDTLSKLLNNKGFGLFVGDEEIRSLYKLNHDVSGLNNSAVGDDYLDVIKYLSKMEFIRKILPVSPNSVKNTIRLFAVKISKKIGLYSVIKQIIWRFS